MVVLWEPLPIVDLFPPYAQTANSIGVSGEVYLDTLPSGRKAIGTHNGSFHADEALAISLLRTLPEFRDHGLILLSV